jgi:hypothetical protein
LEEFRAFLLKHLGERVGLGAGFRRIVGLVAQEDLTASMLPPTL